MSEFESDKAALLGELNDARSELERVVTQLSALDMERARRGSWPVSRILEHVLHSERLYTQLISVFSGEPANLPDPAGIASSEDTLAALGSSRKAFLDSVNRVQQADFYRLQTIGHEEYSVLSILENNAAHDREHAGQIMKTVTQA